MRLLVRIWRAKEAWYDLNYDQRKEIIDRVAYRLRRVEPGDLKTLGWFEVEDKHDPQFSGGQYYCSVYQIKHAAMVDQFMIELREMNWHTYFESHVTASGDPQSPGSVFSTLLNQTAL